MDRIVRGALAVLLAMGPMGCIYVSGGVNPFGGPRQGLVETPVSGEGRDKILLLDVAEVITDVEEEGAFGFSTEESTVARIEEALRLAADDNRVRAVVLRINSPGGGVTASDTIYRELTRFRREAGIPVIAAFQDMATSGAYYIALAADRIVASPTTITGSIGVIVMGLNFEGLMAKFGVHDQTVKSGANKDLLSPFRKSTAAERAIVQGVIDDMYGRFVGLVKQRRPGVPGGALAQVTDGRIFTASQALALGLIDEVGYVDDAIDAAKKAAGIDRARVVMYHRNDEYRENVYSRWSPGGAPARGAGGAGEVALTVRMPRLAGPRFLYLWAPRLDGAP
jgi:protease-4